MRTPRGALLGITLRLDAHYRARPMRPQQAQDGLETAAEVIRLVQQYRGNQ